MTDPCVRALSILRDPSQFRWYVIPLLAFVFYVYSTEMRAGNWNGVFAGWAYLLTDVLWEIGNALLLHFSGKSALWVVPGGTAYLVFVGWSIEIAFMFAVAGVVFTKMLPADRKMRILGVPNRWFFIAVLSCFCAGVECLLVRTPYFHWGYPWWNFPLVALIGYAPFDWVSFTTYDAPRRTQFAVVLGLLIVDVAAIALFGFGLGWI